MQQLQKAIAWLCLFFFWQSTVYGSAFQTPIVSANQAATVSALTIARHADVVAYNPAAMSFLSPGLHLHSGIMLIQSELEWRGPVDGDTSFQETKTDNPLGIAPFFQIAKTSPTWSYGFALKTPFNGAVRWPDDWEGNGIVQEGKIQTISLNPNVSYRFHKDHSVSLGAALVYASLYSKRASPTGPDRSAEVSASGSTWQWNVAYLGVVKSIWIGAHYQSLILPRLEGEIDFDAKGTPLEETLSKEGVDVRYNLPWTFDLSLGWKNKEVKPTFHIDVGFTYAAWSHYKKLEVIFQDGEVPLLGDAVVTENNFRDTLSLHAGLNFRWWEKSIWMVGFENGARAIPRRSLSPIGPIGEQLIFGFGHEYEFTEKISLSATYLLAILPTISTDNTIHAPIGGDPLYGSYRGSAQGLLVSYYHQF